VKGVCNGEYEAIALPLRQHPPSARRGGVDVLFFAGCKFALISKARHRPMLASDDAWLNLQLAMLVGLWTGDCTVSNFDSSILT
jgi:hypothetical protein